MVLSDKYINSLFEGTRFGPDIDGCINKKRALIAKTLRNQVDGYWSGSTAYHIAVNGGFLKDAKSGEQKELTILGTAFMTEFKNT